MRKALGSTILTAALAGAVALPAHALPSADTPSDRTRGTLSASALSPTAAAKLRPALRVGMRSPAVVYVQRTLGVTPTSGYYGTLTRAAVKAWQKKSGLKATGRVDAATWKVLLTTDRAEATAAAATEPEAAAKLRPALRVGMRSPAVVYVQRTLGVTPTSGYYGTLTRAAVKALQKRSGLKASGRVDAATWTVLLDADGVIALPAETAAAPPAEPAPAPEPAPSASGSDASSPEPTRAATPQTPEEAAVARPTLRWGMGPADPAVVYVQRYLQVSPDSGYFGRLTAAAVTAYQKGMGIPATGVVGPLTWAAIADGRRPVVSPQPDAAASVAPTDPADLSAPASPAPAAPAFSPQPGASAAQTAVAFAMAQVGKRYVLGGNGPDVFDCSGLVQQAYLAAGIRLPRLASQQRFAGTRVSLEELQPGDLLYYQDGSSPRRGHISMYAGDGLAVEAANPRRGVRVRDLDERWYADRFVAAVRVG